MCDRFGFAFVSKRKLATLAPFLALELVFYFSVYYT